MTQPTIDNGRPGQPHRGDAAANAAAKALRESSSRCHAGFRCLKLTPLEQQFNVTLSEDEARGLKTVNDAVRLVASKLAPA